MRILVIDKCPKLNRQISRLLTQDGFRIDSMTSIDDAILAIKSVTVYRLVLLDTVSESDDGVSIIGHMRRALPRAGILVTTDCKDSECRIRILNAGADDLISKPFSLQELLACCRALLRRGEDRSDEQTLLQAGNVLLDDRTYEVFVNKVRVPLTKRESYLLAKLMRHQNRIITKANLLDSFFSFSDNATPNAIEALIYRLRKRLTDAQANITISTEHGFGYSLRRNPDEKPLKKRRSTQHF